MRYTNSSLVQNIGQSTRRAAWLVHDFSTNLLVFKSDLLQNHHPFPPNRVDYDTHHSLSRHLDVVFALEGVLTTEVV
jgi:hypothetical protein